MFSTDIEYSEFLGNKAKKKKTAI